MPITTFARGTDEVSLHEQLTNLLLPPLLAVSIALFWLVPLSSSFWIDEIATAFVVRAGRFHPSLAVAPQIGTSIYYFLPRMTLALLGFPEIAYRLPSLLAMGIAVFLTATVAARLIHPRAWWFAVFACLALRGINYQAADARPYALGSCLAAASFWFLVGWLDLARWREAWLFLLFAGLLWRVHLIFWPLYFVFVLYTMARLTRHDTRITWFHALAAFTFLGVILLPVLFEAIPLLRQARFHVIAPIPSLRDLESSLKLGLVGVCGIGAWLLSRQRSARSSAAVNPATKSSRAREEAARWFRLPKSGKVPSLASFVLILGWWLCSPLCLFAFSRLTGISVFLPRYLFVALPGAALCATLAAGLFIPPRHWNRLALVLAVGTLLNPTLWRNPWPQHDNSDWRAAAHQVNELARDSAIPVICPSPFIEARPPTWRPDYSLPGYLYAHLLVYPIQGKQYLFPFEASPEAERFAVTLTEQTLSASGRFVIYGWAGNVRFWRLWFASRPEFAGWRQIPRGPFGNIEVVEFENRSRKD